MIKKLKKMKEYNLKVLLDFARIERLALRIDARSYHVRPLVHVGKQESGADAGLGVKPGASISMPASSDLEVKRTVDAILLCSEYRCQVLCH